MRISDWSSDVCSSDLGVSASDVEIVDPPVDSIDYHIMPVAMFVGQAAMDQPPDQGFAQVGRHDTFDPRAVQTARGQLALHEADDVAAFAHPPQRIRSEEHTSELQSLMRISYAVFCLKKKKRTKNNTQTS